MGSRENAESAGHYTGNGQENDFPVKWTTTRIVGKHTQLQTLHYGSLHAFMAILHTEFICSPLHHTEQAHEEFLRMRCCSYKRQHLEQHYDKLSKRFYTITRMDDVNLTQAFLSSLPDPLSDETIKIREAKRIHLQLA